MRDMRKRRGFTLLELMVVIGIIGILSAILLKAVSGSSDSARAAKCLANMHDLANACHAVAMESGYYPLAGSIEYTKISTQKSANKVSHEKPGWVSWASMGTYRSGATGHKSSAGWFMSTYDTTQQKRLYALTNGAIWKAISGNASSYRCPLHEQCARAQGVSPVWSYVMNSSFGWDDSRGSKTTYAEESGYYFRTLKKLDRRLLLAELPFNVENGSQAKQCKFTTSAGIDLDPTLQYEEGEYIGFNHKTKKGWYAHICFADGHAEKLLMPGAAQESHFKELTEWLCEAKDIGYNGTKYEELKQ